MYTCLVDPTLERVQVGTMQFPLGVYPVEPFEPKQGYAVEFEAADGADDGSDLEEWPDRYVFDVIISADRLPALVLQLLGLMPNRIYPILDFIGHDDYREIDPYISYERMGVDELLDATRQFRGFFYEDGMCGFGAMSEEPFFYLFVDEHKIITIRVEPTMRERIEKLLEAFDLEAMPEPVGVDAAAHEHRSVLIIPDDQTNALSAEEIVGHLRQEWRLTLNVDPETNVDDEGRDLGLTGWRAVIRCRREGEDVRYAEALLRASNLREAEELTQRAVVTLLGDPMEDDWPEVSPLAMDRLTEERFEAVVETVSSAARGALKTREAGVIAARWLE